MGDRATNPMPARRLRKAVARIAEATAGREATGVTHDDADSLAGTIDSDDAIGFDPFPLLKAIGEQGAPAIVIGQVAGILHESRELTGDLDLLWTGQGADSERMVAAFHSAGADLFDDSHTRVDDAERAFALPKIWFRTPSASGDCCTPRLPWKGLDVDAFLGRAVSTEFDGAVVRYVALADLISMRRASGRAKDLRRLIELERLAATSRTVGGRRYDRTVPRR